MPIPQPAAALAPHSDHWIITDGVAGHLRQAQALAAALDWPATAWTVRLRPPWSTLAPRWLGGLPHALREGAGMIQQAPPAMVIGCGRQSATITRWLRRQGHTRAIQILNPGIDPRHWDLVIAPAHDALQGPNVLCPLGSLHPVDDIWLAQARRDWAPLAALPGPRLGLLLGGPRRGVAIDTDWLQALFARLGPWLEQQRGSLLLTGSRRTPPALAAAARHFAAAYPGRCWLGPADGANPYPGVLAWSDRLVVSPDSVNMLSEACATGRPVHSLLPARPLPRRLGAFIQALQARDLLRSWDDQRPPCAPWRETAEIAAQVRQRLALA